MAHVAMDTNNPLGQRPFSVMGGMGDVWDLHEQDRSWIVRDTDSAPIEHMRVPPELLRGMDGVPGAAFLYRPGVVPSLAALDAGAGTLGPVQIVARVGQTCQHAMPIMMTPQGGVSPNWIPAPTPADPCAGSWHWPALPASAGTLLPTGTQSPASSTPAAPPLPTTGLPSTAQIVQSSTQNLVPLATAQPPAFSSIVPAGQPASSAQPVATGSWFSDPAQEVIGGVPNWGLVAGLVAVMVMMKGKR